MIGSQLKVNDPKHSQLPNISLNISSVRNVPLVVYHLPLLRTNNGHSLPSSSRPLLFRWVYCERRGILVPDRFVGFPPLS